MKFKKIRFDNYRCFLNGELVFHEEGEKNINLILGNNGAGKTEMLFAFWWLLYGFDFARLKGKEASPYALNSSLYKAIQDGEHDSEEQRDGTPPSREYAINCCTAYLSGVRGLRPYQNLQ